MQTDENGLYYMRARYYSPELGRFINEDPIRDGLNWYAYAGGNPINRIDPSGLFWKGFWDDLKDGVEIIGEKIADGAKWVADNALDLTQTGLDAFGLVPGVGEAADGINAVIYYARGDNINAALSIASMIPFAGWIASGGKLAGRAISAATDLATAAKGVDNVAGAARGVGSAVETASKGLKSVGFGDLTKASEYGIKPYNQLRQALSGTDLQAHHIIEQRFRLNITDSVALTKAEHQAFTNAWRQAIPYGTDYTNIAKSEIWTAAQSVYSGHPSLLEAARKAIFGS